MKKEKNYFIVPNHYANEYCLQIMLGYKNYAILYGNKQLMCYKNLNCPQNEVNTYLQDEMRYEFPYSTIPEHIERKIFIKINYVNQIFDYKKPYVFIHDGIITKLSFSIEDGKAIGHSQLLNGSINEENIKMVSREEVEKYLKTGYIESIDEEKYLSTYILSIDGILHNKSLVDEKEIITQEKQRLIKIVDDRLNGYDKETLSELKNAIKMLTSVEPLYLINDGRMMLKIKSDTEIKLEYFAVKYIGPNVYKLYIANIPITLNSFSYNIDFNRVKELKEPRIGLLSNPNISKEMVEHEKLKIFLKNI